MKFSIETQILARALDIASVAVSPMVIEEGAFKAVIMIMRQE